jgi:hypothetical protein
MGKKAEWDKMSNGKNIEWKKCRTGQNVEWKSPNGTKGRMEKHRMGQNVK